MADLVLTRDFDATPERVFELITTQAGLLQWWGHEGMTIVDHKLRFDALGPWFSEFKTDEGNRMKMSGVVTHVDTPKSVGFTWGWHGDDDARGDESHVTFAVSPLAGGGARLTLTHADLTSDEQAQNHNRGWTSTIGRLEKLLT